MLLLLFIFDLLSNLKLCNTACLNINTGGSRDRRPNPAEITLVEYNVEWLYQNGCTDFDTTFHKAVGGIPPWGLPFEEATLAVSDRGGHLTVDADNGHQKLVGTHIVEAIRIDIGDTRTPQATSSFNDVNTILAAVQNNDKELTIKFNDDTRLTFNQAHTNGNSDVSAFRANYLNGQIKYLSGPLPATYAQGLIDHQQNIAARLDQINADIFVLIEVCDCATLEATLALMTTNRANYRPYMLDNQPDRLKVGILTKLDPVKINHYMTTAAKMSLIPHVNRGMQLSFKPDNWGDKTLHLMATHLTAGTDAFTARTDQANALKAEWQNKGDYVIITGDFNSFSTHEAITLEREMRFHDEVVQTLTDFNVDPTKLKYYVARSSNAVMTLTKTPGGTISVNADSGDFGAATHRIIRVQTRNAAGATVTTNSDQYNVLNPILTAVQADFQHVRIFFNAIHTPLTFRTHAQNFNVTEFIDDYTNHNRFRYKTRGTWYEWALANLNNHCTITTDTDAQSTRIGKYLVQVRRAGVTTAVATHAEAVAALRAIPRTGAVTQFWLKWENKLTDFYPVITGGGHRLRDVALSPKGPAANPSSIINEVYTMNRGLPAFPRNGRKDVYDYIFVSDKILNNAVLDGAFTYLHNCGAQGGLFSDHDPIKLTITRPTDLSWPAKRSHYGNYLSANLKDQQETKYLFDSAFEYHGHANYMYFSIFLFGFLFVIGLICTGFIGMIFGVMCSCFIRTKGVFYGNRIAVNDYDSV
eukprot:432191_1